MKKVEETFELKPKEVSADTVYGTTGNRVFSEHEYKVSAIKKFDVAEYLKSVTCPNGCLTTNFRIHETKSESSELIVKFTKEQCQYCPLREQCIESKKTKE